MNIENKKVLSYYDDYRHKQKKVGINPRHKEILKIAIQKGLKSNNCVLEIGCGIGTFTKLLSKKVVNGSVLSIDLSPKSIEAAKQNVKNKNVSFLATDITSFEFKNQQFDVIILPDVLEHIPKDFHLSLFKKLSEVLKNDGFVLIHIPDPFYLSWVRQNHQDELQIIDQSLYLDHINHIAVSNDLYIIEVKSYYLWTSPIEYQYIILKKKSFLSNFVRPKGGGSFIGKVLKRIKRFIK